MQRIYLPHLAQNRREIEKGGGERRDRDTRDAFLHIFFFYLFFFSREGTKGLVE